MQSLTQTVRGGATAGKLLPDIFPVLSERGIKPRRGQVVMVAGQPNAGKSMLALNYTVRHNIPTLYVSADTDQMTTVYRTLAQLTGDTVDSIESAFDGGAGEVYADDLASLSNVRFAFDPTPTIDDLTLEVMAFEEVHGQPPELIVIDNLLNIYSEGDSTSGSWSGMVEVMQYLHTLARRSGAGVWVLHHTSESEGKPYLPASRKAIINKASQLPELILTVALDPGTSQYHVACVKNRSGFHDATGHSYTSLWVHPDRMQMYDDFQQWKLADARQAWT